MGRLTPNNRLETDLRTRSLRSLVSAAQPLALAIWWEDANGRLEMNLNDLLLGKGIDPQHVLVLRHRPWEPQLNKWLPQLAAEKPDLFNAYQQTQGERAERAMKSAGYVASFIGLEPGKAHFVGLYTNNGSKPITRKHFWQIPAFKELKAFGMKGFTEESSRSSILWFDLALTAFYAHWKGKLIVRWPGKELSWWRWANKPKNEMEVLAILDESALDAPMSKWDAIDLTWDQLRVLPTRSKSALSQWRGIYYIFDTSDGKGYVGSAYGRGHSQSERPTGQGSVREDVADLAALLEHVELVPAWVVGNSFGASIALRLAGESPGLFRGLIAHEPPLFSLLGNDPGLAPLLEDVQKKIRAVVKRIASGDDTGATEQFVETVALGPGTWKTVPPDIQQGMIENASTFLDEAPDPEQLAFDLEWISGFSKPVLFTLGDQSPPTFAPVVNKLSGALPHAEILTLPGAGHVPHATHPDAYVEAIIEFTHKHSHNTRLSRRASRAGEPQH